MTADESPGARSRAIGRFRLSRLALTIGLILAAGGTLYLANVRRTIDAYVAATDLPAYHQIEERDLRRTAVSTGEVPGDPVLDKDAVIGRYTLAPERQDQPLRRSSLGPTLAIGALDRLGIVALDRDAETSVGGTVRPGDRVDVLLSSTAPGPAAGRVLSNVLVLDVRDTPAAVVLAVSVAQEQQLSVARGSSHPILVRRVPYRRP